MRNPLLLLPFALAIGAFPAPTSAAPTTSVPPALPFEHDFVAALDRARVERKPVFVEAWAPW